MSARPQVSRDAQEDVHLMARVADGESWALAALYDRYVGRAHRVARAVCRDDGRADEAVQEAFISVWRSPASFRPDRGTVAAWLLAVVCHRAIDVARSHGNHVTHHAAEADLDARPAADDVASDAIAHADARGLLDLLAELPDAQREVITLGFYGELSHREIAEHLSLPAGTVKGRMRLGLEKLRGDVRVAGGGSSG